MLIVLSNTPERREARTAGRELDAGVLTVVLPPKPFWYWLLARASSELSKSSAVKTLLPSGDQRTPSLSRKSLETSTSLASIKTWAVGASSSSISFKTWGYKWRFAETSSELLRWSGTARTRPTRSLIGRIVFRPSALRKFSAGPPNQGK